MTPQYISVDDLLKAINKTGIIDGFIHEPTLKLNISKLKKCRKPKQKAKCKTQNKPHLRGASNIRRNLKQYIDDVLKGNTMCCAEKENMIDNISLFKNSKEISNSSLMSLSNGKLILIKLGYIAFTNLQLSTILKVSPHTVKRYRELKIIKPILFPLPAKIVNNESVTELNKPHKEHVFFDLKSIYNEFLHYKSDS